MIETTTPATAVPDLSMYLALGRAALKEREQAKEREAAKQAEENRVRIYGEWHSLLERIEMSVPSEFLTYVVEPENGPREGLQSGFVRGLMYDFAPIGLGPMVAYLTNAVEEGVLWTPPFAAELDTGEKTLVNDVTQGFGVIKREGLTFYEALAVCADRVEAVRAHNEWVTAPNAQPERVDAPTEAPAQVYEGIAPADYAALAGKGGGFWPVLRVGTDRMEVHQEGRIDAELFGADYGAEEWHRDMAVHTFCLTDVPGFGDLYAYVSLIRVHPKMWHKILGAKGA